ncbi:MAG: 6-phosphofructokinase [Saprospiraceae bacterium]
MSKEIKRIAVMTSGGDAPGMNAAIRAVVRAGSYHDLHVYGISRGYEGMINGDIQRLEPRTVGNIIHRGGTFLKTARSKDFRTPEGRKSAYDSLVAHDIDALVVIGGNGTYTGGKIFGEEYDIPIIGVPGTIDNDICGTDWTIGYDSAVNTAMECVDRIRDTAESHSRTFFVEVMGRHSGFIALSTAVATGAGRVLIPESSPEALDTTINFLKKSMKRKKQFSLIIVAEGNPFGGAAEIAKVVGDAIPAMEARVAVIGHLQRGGSPTRIDRIIASRMGYGAVEGLLAGEEAVAIGLVNDKLTYTPFAEAIKDAKPVSDEMMRLAEILAL